MVAQLVDTISAIANSSYEIGNNVALGLPCIIGKKGIERQLVLPRSVEEQRLLKESADKLNSSYNSLDD